MKLNESEIALRRECYGHKKLIVDNISEALSGNLRSVISIDYHAWLHKPSGESLEYVVVTYSSGAIKARTVNMDSEEILIAEIGRLLTEGYYEEVQEYKKILALTSGPNSKWEQLA